MKEETYTYAVEMSEPKRRKLPLLARQFGQRRTYRAASRVDAWAQLEADGFERAGCVMAKVDDDGILVTAFMCPIEEHRS